MAGLSNSTSGDIDPPVVDGALLEAAKENIRPLASGRRATALAGILATPHAKRETLLADKHKRFREDIAQAMANEAKQEADMAAGLLDQNELEAHDTDALGIYSSYVAWTVENYPEGHVSIIPLLEEATRALRDVRNKAYRQDPRYLKLWTRYSELVDKPEVIWRFMLANEIGTEWAAMYEAFASVLERSGKKQAADEIYTLGISRSAQPLMRLQAKYREFQKRMMLAPSSSTSSSATTNPAAAPAVKRKILGDATKKSSDTLASTPAPAPSLAPTPQSTSRSNARLEVFVDDESGGVGSGTSANSWPELGTRTTRTKENAQEVKKMAGTTLKQKGSKSRATPTSTASSSRGGPTFSVFTGPEEDDLPAPSIPASKSGQSTSASAPKRALGSKSGSTVPSRTSSSGGNGSTFSVFTGSEDDPPPRTTSTTEANSEQSGGGFVPFCDDEDDDDTDLSAARSSKPTITEPTKSKTLGPTASLAKAPSLSNVDNHVVKEAEALRKDPLKNYN